MRLRNRMVGGVAVLSIAVLTTVWGCGAMSPGTTLQDLLNSSGLGNVTVADVLSAIQNFTGQSGALPFGQSLSAEQQSKIKSLKEKLNNGEITNQEYTQQLQQIVGSEQSGQPFGGGPGQGFGHGGPGGPHGRPPMGPNLNLTDDQKAQAQTIFDAMRTDVISLQEDAKTQIDAVLTDEQRALLDSLDQGGQPGFRCIGPEHHPDGLGDELNLTDDQKTQIKSIMDTLRDAVDARREQARTDFRAILTTEQLTQLDQFEAEHPRPPHP